MDSDRSLAGTDATLLARREDQAQISDVLIRYATGIDRRDWELFRTCWTADCVATYPELGTFTGADAITDIMTQMHARMGDTYHRMSNVVIDLDGDRAVARSYVHAVLVLTPGDPANWIETIGHYDDVLTKSGDDGWRIAARTSHTGRLLTSSGKVPEKADATSRL